MNVYVSPLGSFPVVPDVVTENTILLPVKTEPDGADWFGVSDAVLTPVIAADAMAGTATVNAITAAKPHKSRPIRQK